MKIARWIAPAIAAALLCPMTGAAAQRADSVALRLNYAGAGWLLAAIERDSLSAAEADSLLRIPGLRAMVDNVEYYFPEVGAAAFRKDVRTFAEKKRSPNDKYWELEAAWSRRGHVRELLAAIRGDERGITDRTLAELGAYRPPTGPLVIDVYFVAGGVSDGFILDRMPAALFINLVREQGDASAVASNMAHEAYHVMQRAAQRRTPGLALYADSSSKLPPGERLLAVTLSEGTANYVVNPLRSTGGGRSIEEFRARYRRNATAERIRENFALFDTMLAGVRSGSVDWNEMYRRGFSGNNDARFYFVGLEMAKAIDAECGHSCVGQLFTQPPREFFRRYVALYRKDARIPGRFSPATEAFVEGDQRREHTKRFSTPVASVQRNSIVPSLYTARPLFQIESAPANTTHAPWME